MNGGLEGPPKNRSELARRRWLRLSLASLIVFTGLDLPENAVANNARKFSGVSDDSVASATGRNWDEWASFLDDLGASGMNHKEVVALCAGPGGVSNGWWQQSVAVGYEQARGLRVVGQTSGADFQIGVQKTLPLPPETAWALLVEGPGRDAWLGRGEPFQFDKGTRYETETGQSGEIRSCVPGQRVRLTWSHPDLEPP